MFLLRDECCARSLVSVAEAAGHTVQLSVEAAGLGRGAPDAAIFHWARAHGAILVSVNAGDFIALAGRGRAHPGVLLIPSLPSSQVKPLFRALLETAEGLFATTPNLFLEIDAEGAIRRFVLP